MMKDLGRDSRKRSDGSANGGEHVPGPLPGQFPAS
jgi:hypothetical protein